MEKLFRGQRVDNGEWQYGDLLNCINGKKRIIFEPIGIEEEDRIESNKEVITKTVGQLIYKQDNQNFFEGDVIDIWMEGCEDEKQRTVICEFGKIHADFGDFEIWTLEWALDADYGVELIGNIYDNPELENECKY